MKYHRRFITACMMLVAATGCLTAQNGTAHLSDSTQWAVDKIAKVNTVMGVAVSSSGYTPEQYHTFEHLKSSATTQELIHLTDHSNGAVRGYAFWAVAIRDLDLAFDIFLQHIDDTVHINTLFGCIGMEMLTGDFFVDVLRGQVDWRDGTSRPDSLLEKVDSVLLYRPNSLTSTEAVLYAIEPKERDYNRIRALAVKEQRTSAYVALARYRKEQDIALLIGQYHQTRRDSLTPEFIYEAIANFPHPTFLPILEHDLELTLGKQGHRFNLWRAMYSAITAFKTDSAARILDRHLENVARDNMREYHLEALAKPLFENRDTVFSELLWKLWRDEGMIAPEVFEFLKTQSPAKTYALTCRDIFRPNFLYSVSQKVDHFSENAEPTELWTAMIKWVGQQDIELADSAIRAGLNSARYNNTFESVADVLEGRNDPSFIAPLLHRLSTAPDAGVSMQIVQLLIAYDNDNINRQILELREKNPELREGWGGKHLTELLREHKLLD